LVAVFKPVFVDDDRELTESAVEYYRQIKFSELEESSKTALIEVFVSWLEQRFKELSKEEIEAMFLTELPDLAETQSGKDLIAIGEERGETKGKREGKREGKSDALERFLRAKHGELPTELRAAIGKLTITKLNRLLADLHQCNTLDDVTAWIDQHA